MHPLQGSILIHAELVGYYGPKSLKCEVRQRNWNWSGKFPEVFRQSPWTHVIPRTPGSCFFFNAWLLNGFIGLNLFWLPTKPSIFYHWFMNYYECDRILCIPKNDRLPWWLRRQSVCLQCRRPAFYPWVGKILWRRKWQPTPVLLPGKSHGWKSLVGYSLWGHKGSDTTERLTLPYLRMIRMLFW